MGYKLRPSCQEAKLQRETKIKSQLCQILFSFILSEHEVTKLK